MFQQIIALIVIAFFIARQFSLKQKKQIGINEFIFWLTFWLLAATAIIFIKQIDILVANIGFSGSGIDMLFYIAVVLLFYLIFKLRLKIEKMDKAMTTIVRKIALEEKQEE